MQRTLGKHPILFPFFAIQHVARVCFHSLDALCFLNSCFLFWSAAASNAHKVPHSVYCLCFTSGSTLCSGLQLRSAHACAHICSHMLIAHHPAAPANPTALLIFSASAQQHLSLSFTPFLSERMHECSHKELQQVRFPRCKCNQSVVCLTPPVNDCQFT
jgi:hypothetical protein